MGQRMTLPMLRFWKSRDGSIAVDGPSGLPQVGVRGIRDGGNTPPPSLIGFEDITDQCPSCKHVAYSCMAVAKDDRLLFSESDPFLPCSESMQRWLEPPLRPSIRRSKWHLKARQEALTILLGSIISLTFTGFILGKGHLAANWFLMFVGASLFFSGKVFYANSVKAVAEDRAMDGAYAARVETWKERMATYANLFYCPHCAAVHDSKTKRRTPWYEFLELMISDPSGTRSDAEKL